MTTNASWIMNVSLLVFPLFNALCLKFVLELMTTRFAYFHPLKHKFQVSEFTNNFSIQNTKERVESLVFYIFINKIVRRNYIKYTYQDEKTIVMNDHRIR